MKHTTNDNDMNKSDVPSDNLNDCPTFPLPLPLPTSIHFQLNSLNGKIFPITKIIMKKTFFCNNDVCVHRYIYQNNECISLQLNDHNPNDNLESEQILETEITVYFNGYESISSDDDTKILNQQKVIHFNKECLWNPLHFEYQVVCLNYKVPF